MAAKITFPMAASFDRNVHGIPLPAGSLCTPSKNGPRALKMKSSGIVGGCFDPNKKILTLPEASDASFDKFFAVGPKSISPN